MSKRLGKALWALLLGCCYAHDPYVATERTQVLNTNTFKISMDGMDPTRKRYALYREGTQACPEGFGVVSDQVGNDAGRLSGYVIIHCQ